MYYKQFLFLILCLFFLSLEIISQPTLLIKIPTRQRPTQLFNVLDTYYQQLSMMVPFLFVISCDNDDLTMNNDAVKQKLNTYPNLYYYYGDSSSKVSAYNSDIEKHLNDFDILLVTSDDTMPCKDYDLILSSLMMEHFPDFDGVINFNDGHVGRILNTLPVIGKKYYTRFNYVYHPSYKSLWCDNEFTFMSQFLNKEFYTDEIIINHMHPVWYQGAYDELYERNEGFYTVDKANFEHRQQKNFDYDCPSA